MGIDLLGPDDERPPDLKPGQPVSNEDALHAAAAFCISCRFMVDADDVMLHDPHGHCICLRCYERETNSAHPMSKELRAAVSQVVNDAPTS